jgi:hypothetical protein
MYPIPLDKQQKNDLKFYERWSPNNWQPSTRIQFLGQMYKLLKLLYLPYPFWNLFYGLDFVSKILKICYQVCCWNAIFLKQCMISSHIVNSWNYIYPSLMVKEEKKPQSTLIHQKVSFCFDLKMPILQKPWFVKFCNCNDYSHMFQISYRYLWKRYMLVKK